MKEWHFFEKTLRVWVVLFIGSPEEFKKELKLMEYDEEAHVRSESAGGMLIELNADNNKTGQDCYVMWLREWSIPTLVHEISHLVMFSFDRCGIPISRDNTEAFAFHTEYWFTEITRVKRRLPDGRTPDQARKQK